MSVPMGPPALKLAFQPDEYLCTWRLPGPGGEVVEAPGLLTLASGRPPRGEVYGELPIEWNSGMASFPQYADIPALTARLANGATAVLTDAQITYWIGERGLISAAAAIVTAGQHGPARELPSYDRVELQVERLDALAGIAPLKHMRFPSSEDYRHLDGTWSVDGNPDSSQEWSDDEITVRLEYDGTIRTFDAYSYGMSFSPVVRIEATAPLEVSDWVEEWIQPIRQIASVATGKPCDLTYFAVRRPSTERRAPRGQVFGVGITQAPFSSSQERVREADSAVFLRHDEISLLSLVRAWQSMTRDRHPLIETYGSMLHAHDQHPRSRFLLLIQAIEGTHGHETAGEFEVRRKAHVSARDAVLEAVEGHLDATQRRFLKTNLRKDPLTGLEDSLTAMVSRLPVDLMPRIEESALVADAKAGPRSPTSAVGALRVVRNDLAHGRRGYDPLHLHEVVVLLERVVRAHALRLLGCPESVLERVLNDR
ncbi:MAG: hypothetical protein KJ056_10295 [Acidimicrobiia bacterium]|nr:hypothetical protein [Acidimicrobiia bacterium]